MTRNFRRSMPARKPLSCRDGLAGRLPGARQEARRIGKHPAETQSQRSDLLQPSLYRDRNRIERFFNRIKQCRRVTTRYGKLAAN